MTLIELLKVHILLTICLNDGKKLSISATTLKKIIVGGTPENGTVFRVQVDLRSLVILIKVEVFFLLVLMCETYLISRQYFRIDLPLSAASLLIRWRSTVGLILEFSRWENLGSLSISTFVRRRPLRSLLLAILIRSILLRPSTSLLLMAHSLPLSFPGSLIQILHLFIETF
jgi:hypothetical protein